MRLPQIVLAEGALIVCSNFGRRQFRKGDLSRRTCYRCKTPLVEVGD